MALSLKHLAQSLAVSIPFALASGASRADVTIGVSLPMTGPASGLGIPIANALKLWPSSIGGQKVNLIVLDDATDPTKGVENAKRFVQSDKVDLVVGSAATPVAAAMSGPVAEAATVQLMLSPAALPPGKDEWSFRLAQSNAVMAHAMVLHMAAKGVKTVGFLGYNDAYGEIWLKDFQSVAAKLAPDIKLVGVERFARADTSVTGQALKLVSANPDAMLVVASGSGAAMPHKALIERGYKGKIYQTHAAASRDLMRVGGKDVEGGYVVAGPATVADLLPATNASKKIGMEYIATYEKAYGAGSRNQFAAHGYDVALLLDKVIPVALKAGAPGTPAFRKGLRDALEGMDRLAISQGVLKYTKDDHWGYTNDTGVVLKVVNGDWTIE
jgi:branched-chain amino acid transport system substrate-binding protein